MLVDNKTSTKVMAGAESKDGWYVRLTVEQYEINACVERLSQCTPKDLRASRMLFDSHPS